MRNIALETFFFSVKIYLKLFMILVLVLANYKNPDVNLFSCIERAKYSIK